MQAIETASAWMLGLYLALQAMLANEFLTSYAHLPIPILIITGIPVVLLAGLSGKLGRFWQASVVIPYLALLLWWWACTVLGSLKGEYMGMIIYGFRFHLMTFVICAIAASAGTLRKVITGYAVGYLGALMLCAKFGEIDSAGRLGIPHTEFANPNDLALNLLIGLSFISILAFDESILKRLTWLVAFGATLLFVLKTGSRANLLTLFVLLFVIFFTSKAQVRFLFVVGTLLMGSIMAFVIPPATRVRLMTFFSFSDEDYSLNQQVANAADSTMARKELQIRALKIAAENPIFGVGPHMFLYALDEYMRREEGYSKGSWQHSHNTYLDLAAETGIPGLALYIACVVWCIRSNYRAFKRSTREPPLARFMGISIVLMLASVALGFGTLFCSWVYLSTFCYIVGLSAAAQLVLMDYDRRRMTAAPVSPLEPMPMPMPAAPIRVRSPRMLR